MIPHLILFAGHSGVGKTTLAKKAIGLIMSKTQASYCLLDKDTVYGRYSSKVMSLTTGDGDDRDSPFYLEHLRDQEYLGLFDIVRENLALGVNVILVGPFSKEIQSGLFFDVSQLGLPESTLIRVAWIDLTLEEAKRRIESRGDARDAWKLAHWPEYAKRRVEPPQNPNLFRFDNTNFDESRFETLIDQLIN
jgi:energy-coupling factor transporter ATP-binding protein EcfA2